MDRGSCAGSSATKFTRKDTPIASGSGLSRPAATKKKASYPYNDPKLVVVLKRLTVAQLREHGYGMNILFILYYISP